MDQSLHQNRASPLASDFYRRRGYRRKFRSEDHFYPFSSQKKSRFASDFLCRGNRASWGLEKSRDFWGSGKNRRRSRRESRDFGALRYGPITGCLVFRENLSVKSFPLDWHWSMDGSSQRTKNTTRSKSKKRAGVPEMGTKPLKAVRGYLIGFALGPWVLD